MGGGKLWKLFKGRCLIDHPLQLLKSMRLNVLVSVARCQPQQDLDLLHQKYPEVQLVEDRGNGGGPLVAIATLLAQSPTDWVLILPVDMPGLVSHDLSPLIAAALQGPTWAAVACVEDQVQPLVGLYSKSALASIREHLETGVAQGPRSWLQSHPQHCQIVPAHNPAHWVNLNTPDNLLNQSQGDQ